MSITKDDMYRAIRGYKYQNCPVLSGLNKTQLGELVNKFDLNVEPTGRRDRPSGAGLGNTWKVEDRRRTTWKPRADRTRKIEGMDVRFTGKLGEQRPIQRRMPRLDLPDDDDDDDDEPVARAPPMKLKLKKKKR